MSLRKLFVLAFISLNAVNIKTDYYENLPLIYLQSNMNYSLDSEFIFLNNEDNVVAILYEHTLSIMQNCYFSTTEDFNDKNLSAYDRFITIEIADFHVNKVNFLRSNIVAFKIISQFFPEDSNTLHSIDFIYHARECKLATSSLPNQETYVYLFSAI